MSPVQKFRPSSRRCLCTAQCGGHALDVTCPVQALGDPLHGVGVVFPVQAIAVAWPSSSYCLSIHGRCCLTSPSSRCWSSHISWFDCPVIGVGVTGSVPVVGITSAVSAEGPLYPVQAIGAASTNIHSPSSRCFVSGPTLQQFYRNPVRLAERS